ncbi:MAG: hypothetical protein ABIK42_02370 [candidate division WOR-3 bacterium]
MEGLVVLLKELSSRSQQVAKRLTVYQRLLQEPVQNAYEREHLLNEIENLASGLANGEVKERLHQWLKEEREKVGEAKEEFRFEFGRKLLLGLEGSGIDVKGQLPFLRVGLFSVRADFATGKATIFWGPEIERLKTGVKLEPISLAKLLRSYQESLTKKAIKEPEGFLQRLYQAYQRLLYARSLPEGERVFLIDLLAELVLLLQPDAFRINPTRERFVDYPRIRFSYDLYLLKRSGVRTVAGKRVKFSVANFDMTQEKAKALWVPDTDEGEGTYYSYIAFVPAGEE